MPLFFPFPIGMFQEVHRQRPINTGNQHTPAIGWASACAPSGPAGAGNALRKVVEPSGCAGAAAGPGEAASQTVQASGPNASGAHVRAGASTSLVWSSVSVGPGRFAASGKQETPPPSGTADGSRRLYAIDGTDGARNGRPGRLPCGPSPAGRGRGLRRRRAGRGRQGLHARQIPGPFRTPRVHSRHRRQRACSRHRGRGAARRGGQPARQAWPTARRAPIHIGAQARRTRQRSREASSRRAEP